MDLNAVFDDITAEFAKQNANGNSVDVTYLKKYTHTGPEVMHPGRLISDSYKIENDASNFVRINYECRDGLRTFQINPDKNNVEVALTIDGQIINKKSYYWED